MHLATFTVCSYSFITCDGVPFLTAVINFFTKCQQHNVSFTDQCEKQSKFRKRLEAKPSVFIDLLLMKHIVRFREKRRAVLFKWGMNLVKLFTDL